MKFAKELEQELVPEWRAKYLDYKVGKKKVKAIARALQKANRTSLPQRPTSSPGATAATSAPAAVPSHHRPSPALTSDHAAIPPTPNRPASAIPSEKRPHSTDPTQSTNQNYPTPPAARAGGSAHTPNHKPTSSLSRSTPVPRPERHPLHTPSSRFSGPVGAYGSIIASPPGRESTASDIASLELPDPALDPQDESPHGGARNEAKKTAFRDRGLQPKSTRSVRLESPPLSPRQASFVGSPGANSSIARRDFEASSPDASSAKRKPQLLKRVFTHQDWELDKHAHGEVPLLESELRRDEFFVFLDDELDKIESFYQMKEEEASRRLQLLRRQLHIMRDRRVQDILAGAKKTKQSGKTGGAAESKGLAKFNSHRIRDVFTGRSNRLGKDTEALAQMASTPGTLRGRDPETVTRRRDFSRRPDEEGDVPTSDVSYRSAKRKLKHALQEFYRGLELLKGYAYLNRTAFRKINKKYDKTVQARPAMRYMSEKVNKAWFVQSEVTESLIAATEDLYARYFERGNRKLTISKLRQHDKKAGDYSSNTFRSGLLLMAGLLFAIQALIYVGQHMSSKDEVLHVRTSYLLQIYGGFFLVVFHFLLFCLVCMIWAKSKINYVFIFEFDIRHALEWRQLLELPSFFFFLLGLFMWLNFFIVNDMYIYWPVVLVGLTLIILFLPARVLYHRSRQWWAYSNWRLVLAGLYPVEFRDFFLGDMYCSQAYSMGNIALFFCLYAKHWSDPPQCNSSHSRLLGFFQCLPAVWRAFQCLRRYGDTRNVFPHLMNFGKYIFSVMYYATLSMYRIRRETRFQATFITFALLNAVYTSVWDLAMDWSLGNPYAKNPLLREVLAFRRAWVYYVAMVLDVVVRFNWIFYAIFANDVQHSAVLSFVVSFSEVCRRGLWTVFRVENEHCTNVLLFRASRDVPLPYELPKPHDETTGDHHPPDTQLAEQQQQQQQQEQQQEQSPTAISTAISQPTDVEQGPQPPTPAGASVRSRRASRAAAGISRVGSIVAAAHAQDFERRKRPEMDPDSAVPENDQGLGDTTDEDEDDSGDGDGDGDEDADGDGSGNADGRGPDEGTYADDLPSTRARISEERV